jgi:hypothetical protein
MTTAQPVLNVALAIERARLRVVIATVILNIVAVAALALVPAWSDWRTGLGLNLVDNVILLAHCLRHRDRFMLHVMAFGLVAGFAELAADAWLVAGTGTLDYSIGGGPMLWRSPAWMPGAWEVVAVQFGYLGLRLVERFGLIGYLMIAVLGAVNIPYYEEMARLINWWRYSGCPTFMHTPWYIIIGEGIIAVALAACARPLRRMRLGLTVLMGLIAGAAIFAGYGIGWIAAQRIVGSA